NNPQMKYTIAFILSVFIMHVAQAQETLQLYPKKIPNSKPAPDQEKREVRDNGTEIISAISIPTITVFIPKTQRSRMAVIIFPGGGYHVNAIKHEGVDIAKEFNDWGVTAFVVKYRI